MKTLFFLYLSIIIIVSFVFQLFIPGFTELFVLNEKAITQLELWRYISAIFLHGDIAHLFLNLFALMLFGIILEGTVGTRNFLLIFFSSGIIANVISVNFYPSSLGASGAIYGVMGTLMIIRPMMMVWAFGIMMPMFLAVIAWITGDILRILGLFDPGNTGSIAHVAGAGIGVVWGFVLAATHAVRKPRYSRVRIPESQMRDWENRYLR